MKFLINSKTNFQSKLNHLSTNNPKPFECKFCFDNLGFVSFQFDCVFNCSEENTFKNYSIFKF